MALEYDRHAVFLELTNDSGFYAKMTQILRNAQDKRTRIFNVHSKWFGIVKPYTSVDVGKATSGYNLELVLEIISHYSEEVFGVYVPADNVKEFIDAGYKTCWEDKPKPDYSQGLPKGYSRSLMMRCSRCVLLSS